MRPNGSPDVHVSTVHFRIPFDLLWSRLTAPLQFPRLYPNWPSQVDREDDLGSWASALEATRSASSRDWIETVPYPLREPRRGQRQRAFSLAALSAPRRQLPVRVCSDSLVGR